MGSTWSAAEATAEDAEAPARPPPLKDGASYECLVIGAGPAGLQAAYFLRKFGVTYALVEAAHGPGSFFETYPRGRRLISINKTHFPDLGALSPEERAEFALRHDWNSLLSDERAPLMGAFSAAYYPHADDLVRYLAAYADAHRLEPRYGHRATRVEAAAGGGFSAALETPDGPATVRATLVFVAAGLGAAAPVGDWRWRAAATVDYGDLPDDLSVFAGNRTESDRRFRGNPLRIPQKSRSAVASNSFPAVS